MAPKKRSGSLGRAAAARGACHALHREAPPAANKPHPFEFARGRQPKAEAGYVARSAAHTHATSAASAHALPPPPALRRRVSASRSLNASVSRLCATSVPFAIAGKSCARAARGGADQRPRKEGPLTARARPSASHHRRQRHHPIGPEVDGGETWRRRDSGGGERETVMRSTPDRTRKTNRHDEPPLGLARDSPSSRAFG